MIMSSAPIVTYVDRAWFTIWSKDEIKKISVKNITDPKSFEKAGVVQPDGLYSLALGPVKRFEVCTTCHRTDLNCPGHFGHIELSVPVFHPMLVQTMFQILNKCCLHCYHFRLPQESLKLFLAQLEALNCGFDHLLEELNELAMDIGKGEKGDAYLHILLGKRLMARIEEEKEKIINFDCQKRPQQRNIVESVTKLFRNFINGNLVKPSKVCPNCDEKKTTISLHQQSVLVLGSNSNMTNSSERIDDEPFEPALKRGRYKKKQKRCENGDLHHLSSGNKQFLTPLGARHCFRELWKNEKRTLQRIFHFLNLKDLKEDDEAKNSDPIDLFFLDTILVPPGKYRPPMSQRGYSFEGPRTAALSSVMKLSVVVQEFIDQLMIETDDQERAKLNTKLVVNWKNLQNAVNSLYDNEMDKYNKNKYPGLKQLLDKKEGLFRKNMMGKRVNFAARSVISPDPNILVDQIGVPLVFAKKLTYPQPVTPWNIKQLKEAILNGPNVYPGAVSVCFEDDVTVSLAKESVRQQIASRLTYNPRPSKNRQDTHKSTIVNRHLLTGDMLLFNRQPTLHKPSIMAFRARVLPNEKGFRLHYANCKSFNADFDGDEMNAHLPQSELARSEAYNIASVNYQYLVPKDGSPLGGLIQDHVVAVCILTRRDQFFDMEHYQGLIYCALCFLDKPIKLEKPTILKPRYLWTGKQIITTLIKNCIPEGSLAPSLNIKSKIGPKILGIKPEFENLSDCHVIIRGGELITGFMDKSNVGATQYGLVHTCYELYGGQTSSAIMSAFSRLSTWYLQLYEGFTLGIRDIIVDDPANIDRANYINESLSVGPDSAKEALGLAGSDLAEEDLTEKLREAHSDRNPLPMKKLDAAMKSRTDKIASAISSRCLPDGLIQKFPDNNLQMMIQSGAKGGTVNALQISCLLGQIELEGRRVPLSMSGRSLPSFKPYDTSPKAGGFVSGRFLTGIQPQEFFFHCMAGREGLIDTAVKTSRSGYLQRCLIKHLEGLTVNYDQTVRDSCGSVIQFLYGEDGLDIVKSQMLKEQAFPLLVENYNIVKPNQDEMTKLNKSKETYEEEVISRTNDIMYWIEKNGDDRIRNIRGSGFLDFLAHQFYNLKDNQFEGGATLEKPQDNEGEVQFVKKETGDNEDIDQSELAKNRNASFIAEMIKSWYALSFKEKKKWNKEWEICPDPLIALMNPGSHFGVVPEKLDQRIEAFVKKNAQLIADPANLLGVSEAFDDNPELSRVLLNENKITKHEFYNLCYNLYMKMLAQPGEAVGLLAAQSIGEPSTQMTLNTFHFAGRGEMNVTLGIPRLREILMTASANIGTPSMDLPLLKELKDEFGNDLNEEEIEDQAMVVKLALNAVRLSDVLEYVDITEQVVDVPVIVAASQGRKKAKKSSKDKTAQETGQSIRYEIYFSLLPSKYYKHEFRSSSSRVLRFIEEVFVVQLVDSMIRRQKRLHVADSMFDLSTKRLSERNSKTVSSTPEGTADNDIEEEELEDYNAKARADEKAKEDESSSEDEEEEADGDNTTSRIKSRRNQDLDYEEPEDDDLEVGDVEAQTAEVEEDSREVLADDEEGLREIKKETQDVYTGQTSELAGFEETPVCKLPTVAADMQPEQEPGQKRKRTIDVGMLKERIDHVKCKPYVIDYEFDVKRERWCKLTICADLDVTRIDMGSLIESEAKRTFVHRVGNISRALIVRDVDAKSRGSKCDKMIKTEGVSLLSLVRYDHILDLNAIYSNDIHAIARTYGIEAASKAIRREMANVFAVYGIEVDPRHLSLIADYMTYNGSIRGMNRMSMECSASPFQQMSFESTIRYLKSAAILGLYDDINSPSAALVFGQPTRGGTGLFGLLADK